MKQFEQMSNDELKDTALRLGIRFDWSAWASPRYQLIQAIKAAQRTAQEQEHPDDCRCDDCLDVKARQWDARR